MEKPEKLQRQYDHVIVGYNLSSLALASQLAQKQESFCILDSRHRGSHGVKWIPSMDGRVATRVPFNPVFENEEMASFPLGDMVEQEGPPLTFEKGEFKSFLGFGEHKVVAQEAILPFCHPRSHKSQKPVEYFWNQALEKVESQLFLDQQITHMEFQADQLTRISLNGSQALEASQFSFFQQFPLVFEKLGQVLKKEASRFAKSQWFSSVNLVIHHQDEPELFELDQLYLLMGSKNQACLGQFSQVDGHLISRWETFLPAELTPNSEATGMALKEIKKQVKRAFFSPSFHQWKGAYSHPRQGLWKAGGLEN